MSVTNAARESRGLRALVVEDEPDLGELLCEYLTRGGFDAQLCVDGQRAVDVAQKHPPDLIVLDLGLPSLDGVEVCRRLRTFTDAYIVMVTARTDEVDTLIGLSVGADDYMTKPLSPRVLMARIDAVLRRPRQTGTQDHDRIDRRLIGDLVVDPSAREAHLDGSPIELTRTEFDILEVLSSNPRVVFRRAELIERVWGADHIGDDHVVEVHIASLRRKLGDSATTARFIRTVRGVGYRIGTGIVDE